jgi:hypothetical protein
MPMHSETGRPAIGSDRRGGALCDAALGGNDPRGYPGCKEREGANPRQMPSTGNTATGGFVVERDRYVDG